MAHPKGVLLERAQKLGLERPEFRTERTGPEHEPLFLSDVVVGGEVLGTGQGGSKRTAEKNAAEEALAALDQRESGARAGAAATQAKTGRGRGRGAAGADAAATTATGSPAKATAATSTKAGAQRAATAAAKEQPAAAEDEVDESPFTGPWPMFDDLLAAVLGVAERRVSSELRGDAARVAVRDFALQLYKELLADLGEVVDDEDDEDEDED